MATTPGDTARASQAHVLSRSTPGFNVFIRNSQLRSQEHDAQIGVANGEPNPTTKCPREAAFTECKDNTTAGSSIKDFPIQDNNDAFAQHNLHSPAIIQSIEELQKAQPSKLHWSQPSISIQKVAALPNAHDEDRQKIEQQWLDYTNRLVQKNRDDKRQSDVKIKGNEATITSLKQTLNRTQIQTQGLRARIHPLETKCSEQGVRETQIIEIVDIEAPEANKIESEKEL
ncbi:hypothetical protein EJ08DRAFT_699441 [Tothia fuscella]|uniref:Uncharacterized protein n=1 Tax=Tothia fuscella TaxID=1048955 RepID=A0A9P4TWW1_9PEZI|nr:hypothetical protein EJ08DRAFT_699441 [Tothia fuscella]